MLFDTGKTPKDYPFLRGGTEVAAINERSVAIENCLRGAGV